MSAESFILTMLDNSLTDKISDAVNLFENRMHCRRRVKAITLHGGFLAACTGATTASFLCRFFHNSPKLIAQNLMLIKTESPLKLFAKLQKK